MCKSDMAKSDRNSFNQVIVNPVRPTRYNKGGHTSEHASTSFQVITDDTHSTPSDPVSKPETLDPKPCNLNPNF